MKVVGYACGVFDLFHKGHINILKEAKKQCDILIVGVTTDICAGYKNKIPIINEHDRAEVVGGCKYVDKVIFQESLDKFEAWEKIKFDKLFVGSDWQGHEKWVNWEEKLNKVGVEVVYIPYTLNISSTSIRESLNPSRLPVKSNTKRTEITTKAGTTIKFSDYDKVITATNTTFTRHTTRSDFLIDDRTIHCIKELFDYLNQKKYEYSLYGGGVLGYIRSKNFMPYDDDLDICMARSEWLRLRGDWDSLSRIGWHIIPPNFQHEFIEAKKEGPVNIYRLCNNLCSFSIDVMQVTSNGNHIIMGHMKNKWNKKDVNINHIFPSQPRVFFTNIGKITIKIPKQYVEMSCIGYGCESQKDIQEQIHIDRRGHRPLTYSDNPAVSYIFGDQKPEDPDSDLVYVNNTISSDYTYDQIVNDYTLLVKSHYDIDTLGLVFNKITWNDSIKSPTMFITKDVITLENVTDLEINLNDIPTHLQYSFIKNLIRYFSCTTLVIVDCINLIDCIWLFKHEMNIYVKATYNICDEIIETRKYFNCLRRYRLDIDFRRLSIGNAIRHQVHYADEYDVNRI